MFTSKIKTLIVAASVALGTLAATATAANAGGRGSVYIETPGISIGFGDRRHRGDRWDRREHRSCSPHKAIRKAERRGVRRAHVVRVGHRGVIVAGRQWGERVVIGFGGHRSCPVRFVSGR